MGLITNWELAVLVNFRELVAVVNRYRQVDEVPAGEQVYSDCIRRRDVWDRLQSLTESQVRETVVSFPNKWKTRIPYGCVPELTTVLRTLADRLSALRGERLLNVDFSETRVGPMKISEVIVQCFETISKVQAESRRFGFTGTTKVMHMIIPELFIMCDRSIAEGYGYAQNAVGYGKFIVEMKHFARSLVDNYKLEFEVDDPEAIVQIQRLCNDEGKAFTKTLDEFNYATYTLGL